MVNNLHFCNFITAKQTTMKNATLTYEIHDSVIPQHVIDGIQKTIAQFKGKEIDITIGVHKKKRSNPQNAYLHGVVIPMVTDAMHDLGNEITQSQTKDMLKNMFLTELMSIDDTNVVEVTQDTSALTTTEFMMFVERVQRWGAEMLGVIIPDPNENLKFEQ